MPDNIAGGEFQLAMRRGPVRTIENGLGRPLASGVICSFLALAAVLNLADSPFVSETTGRQLRTIGYFFGMRQAWRLFGPELREYNLYTTVITDFQDGTMRLTEFPRMEKMSLLDRFIHEKKRSIFNQFLPTPKNIIYYPSVARYYVQAFADRDNQPSWISFVVSGHATPPPDSAHWVYRDQLPLNTYKTLHFNYPVMPPDLVTH